jgi:pyridoxal phosphate enzyme (YggS family)
VASQFGSRHVLVGLRVRIAQMAPQDTLIASNLAEIRERIARSAARVGRAVEDITLVAVSKTFPSEAIRSAYELGLRHFGENRVQEWESKRAAVADLDATWHLIGHLQSNKARRAANLFDRVDSVDRVALAQKLDVAAASEAKRLKILI